MSIITPQLKSIINDFAGRLLEAIDVQTNQRIRSVVSTALSGSSGPMQSRLHVVATSTGSRPQPVPNGAS